MLAQYAAEAAEAACTPVIETYALRMLQIRERSARHAACASHPLDLAPHTLVTRPKHHRPPHQPQPPPHQQHNIIKRCCVGRFPAQRVPHRAANAPDDSLLTPVKSPHENRHCAETAHPLATTQPPLQSTLQGLRNQHSHAAGRARSAKRHARQPTTSTQPPPEPGKRTGLEE